MQLQLGIPAALAAAFAMEHHAVADTSYTINNATADAFIASGSPGNPVGTDLTGLNFGSVGTLAIAPASSAKGEFDSIIKFNSASAVVQFNSVYGAGNWQITGLTLQLASNFGGQGEVPSNGLFNTINAGSFGIDWLANDAWVEGTGGPTGSPGYPSNTSVSYNSIPGLFAQGYASLGTFAYHPPGDNVYASYSLPLNSSLATDAAAGGDISLYFYAADSQVSYLFNARNFSSNHPEFTVTVAPIPEPASGLMIAGFLGTWWAIRRSARP